MRTDRESIESLRRRGRERRRSRGDDGDLGVRGERLEGDGEERRGEEVRGGPGAVGPAHDLEHRTHDEAQPRDHRRPGIGRGVRLGRGQLRHGETRGEA